MMVTLKFEDIPETQSLRDQSKFIDFCDHDFVNKFVWGCSTTELHQRFDALVSDNHLDLGIQGGYLLQELFSKPVSRLVITEDDNHPLTAADETTSSDTGKLYSSSPGDWPANMQKFDSVSVNYVLHRIMGNMEYKGQQVFSVVSHLLNPNGGVFGTTIIGRGIDRSFLRKKVMNYCNDRFIFNNRFDSVTRLRSVLEKYFIDIDIEVIGSVAVFQGKKAN